MNVALYHAPFGTRSYRRRDSSHDSVMQISRNRLHSAASSKRPHAQAPFLRRSWLSFSTAVRNAAGFLEIEETPMIQRFPIHDLLTHLETERLKAVQELAAKPGALPADTLQGIAILQTVLTAVREEIAAHEVRVGSGAARPLE